MNTDVCAIVITYHPGIELARNLEMLARQVDTILIVDNNSSMDEVVVIRKIVQRLGISLLENKYNTGIGTALNQAVTWTRNRTECRFVLFLDQDSSIAQNFVATMVTHYQENALTMPIFLVTPLIVDSRTGDSSRPRLYGGQILVAQTSGSLMPVEVFNESRMFKEDLFIDYVDYEFCLRLAEQKWNILFCYNAILQHNPGNLLRQVVKGHGDVTTYNYSPLRHYYLTRNRMWMLRRYLRSFPLWGIITVNGMFKEMIHVLRFEKQRRSKSAMWWRGFVDAASSKMGKLK